MKSIEIIFAVMLFSTLFLSHVARASETVSLEYFFYNPGDCPTCYDYTYDNVISEIETKYYGQVLLERIDIRTNLLGRERFNNYTSTLGLTGVVPAVVINHVDPVSKEGITVENLDKIISQYLEGSITNPPSNGNSSGITLPLVVISAFIDGINPCAFALLVFFLSYLFSIQRSRGNILAMGSMYVLGLFITYFLIGFGLLRSVSFFGIAHFFGLIGVILMIALGIVTIADYIAPGRFTIKFPSKAVPTFKSTVQKATIPAALLLGGLVGLCEFPCTGAIYGGVLAYLASETTFLSGVSYLVLYNFIFVLPLIVVLLFASNVKTLTRIDSWRLERRRQVKLFSGIFMIVFGLLILYWLLL